MNKPTVLSRFVGRVRQTKFRGVSGTTAILTLAIAAAAGTLGLSIFRPFPDDSGKVQSAPSDVMISTSAGSVIQVNAPLDATNKFFDPGFGTNGQACVTCHLPSDGFTVHVDTIGQAFTASAGTDPLFRANDTADNPNAGAPTPGDYSVILNQGAIRIGKTFAAASNFTAVAADAATDAHFAAPDHFPLTTDPQHPGVRSLSLFRRPLVNTNVHLDSSVLWDGRASIGDMRAQVIGAAKTLLLAPAPTAADADQVAAFMLGVYTDQRFDNAAGTDANGNCTLTTPGAQCGARLTSALGARGGVKNLLALALSSKVPCANFLESPCIANVPGYSIFNAWKHIPNLSGINAGRASVVRGQIIFNTAVLNIPSDLQAQLGTTGHCTTCHAARNIGNNPDATFFARVGTDSVQIVSDLIAANPTDTFLPGLLARVQILPQYCLRSTLAGAPSLSAMACGTFSGNPSATPPIPGDVITTDPGRAMVSGDIADVGKFKPPILRGLAARSPYFHAGVAENIQALIHFYKARFNITFHGHPLTENEVNDLGAFLEAQ